VHGWGVSRPQSDPPHLFCFLVRLFDDAPSVLRYSARRKVREAEGGAYLRRVPRGRRGGQRIPCRSSGPRDKACGEIPGGACPFPRVAFQATRDQVAVGIAPELRLRHDMFEALPKDADLPQAIETPAALTSVDGLAQLRSTSRKAPWSIRRPTAGRTAPSQRRVPRASQAQPLDDIVFALFLDKFGFIVVHVFEPEGRKPRRILSPQRLPFRHPGNGRRSN